MTDNSPSSTIVTESGKNFYRNSETQAISGSSLTNAISMVSSHTDPFNAATYFVAMRFPNTMTALRCPIGFINNFDSDTFEWKPISGTTIRGDMQHASKMTVWTIEINKWYVFEFEYTSDRTAIRARIYNNPTDTTYHSAPGNSSFNPMKLALGCSVDIGEVIYYNTALTASDSNTVCQYLKNKWVPTEILGVFGSDYTTAVTTEVNTLEQLILRCLKLLLLTLRELLFHFQMVQTV